MDKTATPLGRRGVLAGAVTVVLAASMGASAGRPAPAQSPACPLGMTGTAHAAPAGGVAYTSCTGRVASFDGTPLDVDLTLPATAAGPLPLMVMLHGWGLSKTDFEVAGNTALVSVQDALDALRSIRRDEFEQIVLHPNYEGPIKELIREGEKFLHQVQIMRHASKTSKGEI